MTRFVPLPSFPTDHSSKWEVAAQSAVRRVAQYSTANGTYGGARAVTNLPTAAAASTAILPKGPRRLAQDDAQHEPEQGEDGHEGVFRPVSQQIVRQSGGGGHRPPSPPAAGRAERCRLLPERGQH